MHLNEFLVRMRQHSGKTQAQIAKATGVSLRTWQNYEQGLGNISAMGLFKASVYCRYDISDILNHFMPKTNVNKERSEQNQAAFDNESTDLVK